MSKYYLQTQIKRAIEAGRTRDCIDKLPGAPNTNLIIRGRSWERYNKAVEAEKAAKEAQVSALVEIADELLEDWTEDQLLFAFA